MKKAKWLLEAALVIVLSFPLAVLPHRTAGKVGEFLGLFLFSAWRRRRKIALDNIRRALPCLDGNRTAECLARQAFRNLGRSAVEIIRIYYGRESGIIDAVEIRGAEHYDAARSKGKGVLFITGHCGNWELMALAFGRSMGAFSAVARAQNNPYLNRIIERARASYGNAVLYKKGALRGILSRLGRGETVGVLMDQAVVKEEGVVVDFLGRGAWTMKTPALVARKTGAAVLPVFIHREGNGHVITISPEVSLSGNGDTEKAVREDTESFSRYIEDYVRRHPDEWLWIHRRWKRVPQ
ncbi:MAG: lysophospholipid acyltransferase family protein [Alphaproteobacteria bacterium]|uniref:Lysophospholipid acyltransferase family protein n=1 Tax=Candidatus Nitrobium versatile TaxID=2884831 RepID=A0A953M059_9BACT|nr:lysophospholipid acyltransferase family protein [Candidatus Nitrobium versatile]